MTEPTESPGTVFHLLSLYAALDRAVLESADPNVAAMVERFLPGSTGVNQRGWSRELERFLGLDFVSLEELLSAVPGFAESTPLTAPELSRLVYAVGSLMHLPPDRIGIDREQFLPVLALARPQTGASREPGLATAFATGGPDQDRALYDVIEQLFTGRSEWSDAVAEAVRKGLLDPAVARVGLCNACVTNLDGYECVLVDTRSEDDSVSIEQVKAILDPRNWSQTAGQFFCQMQDLGPREQAPHLGWGRVLEQVSAWCGVIPPLRTQLKFCKADNPSQAVVQYDLDETLPNQGDGLVKVDKGWLKVAVGTSANAKAGVTLTTRKVVHIDPLSPVAQRIFVCESGYGSAAEEMLLGHAKRPPMNLVAWLADPKPLQTATEEQDDIAWLGGTQAAQPPPGQPGAAPAGGGGGGAAAATTAAGLAVSMFSDYLAEVVNDSSQLAAKFADQDLSVDDLVKFSARLGARMASEPWKFVQKLSELPPPSPGGGPGQGG